MITNDKIINSLLYDSAVDLLIKNNMSISEAKSIVSKMSFLEHKKLVEASADIVPPSGKPISQPQSPGTPASQQKATAPSSVQPPPSAKPAGTPATTDPRGVQVRNPATGKMEWMTPTDPANAQQVAENRDLARMRKLAGIVEDSSCGATSAGAIASSPASVGKIKRRSPVEESPSLEHPIAGNKTVQGATAEKTPAGTLSANLAVRGQKTATRKNNGFKR